MIGKRNNVMKSKIMAWIAVGLFVANVATAREARRLFVDIDKHNSYNRFDASGFSYRELVGIVEVTSGVRVDVVDMPDGGMDVLINTCGPDTVLRMLFEVQGYVVEARSEGHYVVVKQKSVPRVPASERREPTSEPREPAQAR